MFWRRGGLLNLPPASTYYTYISAVDTKHTHDLPHDYQYLLFDVLRCQGTQLGRKDITFSLKKNIKFRIHLSKTQD